MSPIILQRDAVTWLLSQNNGLLIFGSEALWQEALFKLGGNSMSFPSTITLLQFCLGRKSFIFGNLFVPLDWDLQET